MGVGHGPRRLQGQARHRRGLRLPGRRAARARQPGLRHDHVDCDRDLRCQQRAPRQLVHPHRLLPDPGEGQQGRKGQPQAGAPLAEGAPGTGGAHGQAGPQRAQARQDRRGAGAARHGRPGHRAGPQLRHGQAPAAVARRPRPQGGLHRLDQHCSRHSHRVGRLQQRLRRGLRRHARLQAHGDLLPGGVQRRHGDADDLRHLLPQLPSQAHLQAHQPPGGLCTERLSRGCHALRLQVHLDWGGRCPRQLRQDVWHAPRGRWHRCRRRRRCLRGAEPVIIWVVLNQ
mmetsp:Transcript_12599/g.32482  ORF Transcript_12599/g.32482 Transcript_12599/m.32482 type:complete len:285 (+) Transcript_12599:906-1760(+)